MFYVDHKEHTVSSVHNVLAKYIVFVRTTAEQCSWC